MKKTKKEIREMVTYILDIDDKDIIEGYAGTFDDIIERFAKRKAIKFAKFCQDWTFLHLTNKQQIKAITKLYKGFKTKQ